MISTVCERSISLTYPAGEQMRILLLSRVKMVDYEVTISTSFLDDAGTSDNVFIKLVGFDGSSEHKKLEGDSPFIRGAVSCFTVSCPASIGKLQQIQLYKQPLPEFPEGSKWFPTKVVVKSPEGETDKFLILQWIIDCALVSFTEERGHLEGYGLNFSGGGYGGGFSGGGYGGGFSGEVAFSTQSSGSVMMNSTYPLNEDYR
ncbi:hydroperoxide isomerase ALOXE3-like [Sebastes fasciatus]|uniref:hydroperoxide isomerase ALOXE3-like n=1 Tax=Sebastes fasciatus TaxID=394691 RepID=UPI003D9E5C42